MLNFQKGGLNWSCKGPKRIFLKRGHPVFLEKKPHSVQFVGSYLNKYHFLPEHNRSLKITGHTGPEVLPKTLLFEFPVGHFCKYFRKVFFLRS